VIKDCTAIVLAGGASARMGRDKAELVLGQEAMLQRVIGTMQQIFPDVILSVRRPRHGISLRQVCDETGDVGTHPVGPLAGLVAGLKQISTQWAFVVACDMPFVVPAMVELLASHRAGYQAVIPVVHGYVQPLAAFYARTTLDVIRARLAGAAGNSLRELLKQLEACYVDEAELLQADPMLCSFFDVDTPRDFDAAMNML
jgi:molybdopterin-guanine dinucleotide biosynthesis protein A